MSKIYLSSTPAELREYREAVIGRLRLMGHEVVSMESLAAASGSPLPTAFGKLAESDGYIGIFAHEYGFIPSDPQNPERLSLAELEYRQAQSLGVPCLIFLMGGETPKPGSTAAALDFNRMAAFRKELMNSRTVRLFVSQQNLSDQVQSAIANLPPRNYHVFLSHNSLDEKAVGEIAEHLQDDGIRVWWDKGDLTPGDEWQWDTEAAFARAPVVAMIIGPEGIGPLQNGELDRALARAAQQSGFRLIPVILPNTSHERVPPELLKYQWVDFGASLDNPAAYAALKRGIWGTPAVSAQTLSTADLQMLPELLFRLVSRLRERPEMLHSLEVTAFWAAVRKIQSGASTIEDLRTLHTQLASEPAPGALWAAWIRNTRSLELAALVQYPPSAQLS